MVKLRKLVNTDLRFLLEVRNHNSTRKFLENNSYFSYEECKVWFKTYNPLWYIIEVNNESVGYIRTNKDEVGCDIHPNFRQKGYAKEAYQLYLKDKLHAELWVFEDNFAKKLYKKLGFVETSKNKQIRNKKYIHMEYNKTKK